MLAGGLARVLVSTPFIPELLTLRLFESLPLGLFDLFVRQLGPFAKWIALGITVAFSLFVSGLLGYICSARFWGRTPTLRWMTLTAFLFVTFSFGILPLLGFSLNSHLLFADARVPAAIGVAFATGAYALAFTGSNATLR